MICILRKIFRNGRFWRFYTPSQGSKLMCWWQQDGYRPQQGFGGTVCTDTGKTLKSAPYLLFQVKRISW